MSEPSEGVGSAREEAERLVAAGLGAVATALQGMEARRQLQTLAEQLFSSDRVQDLAAGLGGFMSAATTGDAGTHAPTGDAGTHAPAGDAGVHAPAAGSARFSTGSADCCVCPVCRVIAALRDPSPELAERLASAAGDLAVGVAGVMRAFSAAPSARPGADRGAGDDGWTAATTTGAAGPRMTTPSTMAAGGGSTVPPPRSRPPDSEILVTPISA